MAKRKAAEVLEDGPRRSSRRKTGPAEPELKDEKSIPKKEKAKQGKSEATKKPENAISGIEGDGEVEKDVKPAIPKKKTPTKAAPKPDTGEATPTGRQYWLMKAEPESRLEKGHDIKFSIDDLAAKSEPESWDGIRAYPARNNLRAMKKGDLAFFYHSSCKVPAIVGIMEIVAEHSPDLSAHDPSAPYHDPSSTPSNPKWSVVHVSFRQKLATPITLKELRAWGAEKDGPLSQMQMLKLARLSVSRVSEAEWQFLVGQMRERGDVVRE